MPDLYFNHAGTSWPKPRVVTDAVCEAMLVSPGEWPQRFDDAHQRVAEFFGVCRRKEMLLTPGCTSSLAVGIADSSIAAGKRVLTSSWEHHALHRPLLKRTSTGVRIEHVPPLGGKQESESVRSIDLDWLERELSKHDVGLVAITAACNVTGEILPYEAVIEMAHTYGARVLVDAAQIVGWRQLNLPDLGADVVAFGGHKGLQAPWGIGGLYISEETQMECTSTVCELPSTSGTEDQPRPGYCDVGSVDQFALAGLHAAIDLLCREKLEDRLAKARKQVERIRGVLQDIDRIQLFGPARADQVVPTVAFSVVGCSSGAIASKLRQRGLVVGSGLHCAPIAHQTLGTHTSGLVRLSIGNGQSDEDVDNAIDRLLETFDE